MSVNVRELGEKRKKLVYDCRAIVDRAQREKRDMNSEEKAQFDRMMDRVDELAKKLEARDDADDEENDDDPGADAETESQRSRRFLQGRSRSRQFYGNDGGSAIEARSSKRYARGYAEWLRSGTMSREFRDLSLATPSAGGYLVTPVKLAEDIVIAINNLVFIRKLADIQKVVDAQSLGNPQLTADIQPITWGNEVTVSTADTTMTFGRRDLTPNMATNLIKVSFRELQAAGRVEDLVSQRVALSFAYGEEQAYLTGSGSGQPLGLFTPSSSGIPTSRDYTATGASHTIAADDLFGMVYSIPQQYQNAKTFGWIAHRNVVKQCVTLKDANEQYLWNVSGYISPLTGKRSDSLCGFPMYQSEFAPSNASPATGNYVMTLGDYAYYRIAETMAMEIQRMIELFALTGEIGFLARKFVDGAPVLPAAFSRLVLS